eukprot:1142881-Pelagomonas_calceolata.AAC.3
MKGQNTSCAQALEARGDNAATWVASKLGLPLPSGESISPRKGFEGQQPDMLSAKATPLPDKDIPDRGTQRIVPVIDGAEGVDLSKLERGISPSHPRAEVEAAANALTAGKWSLCAI